MKTTKKSKAASAEETGLLFLQCRVFVGKKKKEKKSLPGGGEIKREHILSEGCGGPGVPRLVPKLMATWEGERLME